MNSFILNIKPKIAFLLELVLFPLAVFRADGGLGDPTLVAVGRAGFGLRSGGVALHLLGEVAHGQSLYLHLEFKVGRERFRLYRKKKQSV